jgi:hypothetical protein
LIIGTAHPDRIGRDKKLKNFDFEDLRVLREEIAGAGIFVTLPYILAEVSNLLGIGKRNEATLEIVSHFISFVSKAEEIAVVSRDVASEAIFARYGLTDTAILRLLSHRVHVLTVDFALYGKLVDIGIAATNLRHLSPRGWS